MKINNPFWKTNILIIDTLLQYIFLFCLIIIIHNLNSNNYYLIVLFSVILWIVYYIQSTYALWNNNTNDRTIRSPFADVGDYSGMIVWGWITFILLTLIIITSVNKQYNILSILLLIRVLYQIGDASWDCMYRSPLGNFNNILIAIMVYILLLINIKNKHQLYYPIVSTFVVFLSEVFRLMVAPSIGYLCI